MAVESKEPKRKLPLESPDKGYPQLILGDLADVSKPETKEHWVSRFLVVFLVVLITIAFVAIYGMVFSR